MSTRVRSPNVDRLAEALRRAGADDLVAGVQTLMNARDKNGHPVRLGDEVRIEGQEWRRTGWVVSELRVKHARIVSAIGKRDVLYSQLERV